MAFYSNWFRHNRETEKSTLNSPKRRNTTSRAKIDSKIDKIIGDERKSQNNPNFGTFYQVAKEIEAIVAANSVINNSNLNLPLPTFQSVFDEFEAFTVDTNKSQRIQQYRIISAFLECNWAIEEIADDFLHEDEQGKFIHLTLPAEDPRLNDTRLEILQNEFERFIGLFHWKDEAFNLIKRFVIEGELAWENIIDPERPELGIIGLKFLPVEYYEILFNENGDKIGLAFDYKRYKADLKLTMSSSFYSSRQIFNNTISMGSDLARYDSDNCVIFPFSQLTYINSGNISPDGLICYPIIEGAKQAYYQLALLFDAAVILRVTRSPERLLFNISTGNMTPKESDEYVKKFGNQLRNKKVPSVTRDQDGKASPSITNVYNPSSMLEAWVFGKSNANDGSTVEAVNSMAQYDQIEDLKFFLRRFFKAFKVPWSRFEAPENINEQNDTMTYEEYAFSRQEIRIQNRVKSGIKKSFITNLKLRGIWDKYNLRESDINIEFVKPVLYDLNQIQKLMEAKVGAYATLADREEFSKQVAMRNILKMTEEEIKDNFDKIVQEKIWMASAEYWANKLDDNNPPDKILNQVSKMIKDHEVNEEPNESENSETEGDEGTEEGGDLESNPGLGEGEGAEGSTPTAPEEEGEEENPPTTTPEEGGSDELNANPTENDTVV